MPEPWTYERARSFFDYEAQPKRFQPCDLCGNCDLRLVAQRDRYGFNVMTDRCLDCGLVFQNPAMEPAGLRALYSGPYRALVSAWHGREINAETLEPEQREYGRRLAGVLAGKIPPLGGRVLDLGGSTGVVADAMADQVYAEAVKEYERTGNYSREPHRTTVVEPNPAEAVAAIHHVDRVVVQSAEDFDPGDERWDLILLCQTVDHLRSISAVLRKVRKWLAPGGRFFVDAVDVEQVPEAERYKVDHIYSLTRATMRAYLERAGFVAREVPAPSERHVAFLCEVAA